MKKALMASLLVVIFLSGCVTVRRIESPGPEYDFVPVGGTVLRTKKATGEGWLFYGGYWIPIKESEIVPAVPQSGVR